MVKDMQLTAFICEATTPDYLAQMFDGLKVVKVDGVDQYKYCDYALGDALESMATAHDWPDPHLVRGNDDSPSEATIRAIVPAESVEAVRDRFKSSWGDEVYGVASSSVGALPYSASIPNAAWWKLEAPKPVRVRLTVEVVVEDPLLLEEYARELWDDAWPGDGSFDEVTEGKVENVLYEALVGSNGNAKSPEDYGIRLLEHEAVVTEL
jgi:hypothetical protein